MVVRESTAEIKSKLRKEWHNQKDINVAMDLLGWLEFLDKRLFPSQPLEIEFITSEWDFIAQYYYPRVGVGEESYGIYLYRLAERLKEATKNMVLVTRDNKRIKYPLGYSEKKKILLIAVAAHEVRHRLQRQLLLKNIREDDGERTDDPLLRRAIEIARADFKRKREAYESAGKPPFFIRKSLDGAEFDATVIDRLIAGLLYEGVSWRKIISAVKTQV